MNQQSLKSNIRQNKITLDLVMISLMSKENLDQQDLY